MNWKKFWSLVLFVFVWVVAITLIENEAGGFFVDFSSDFAGATMFIMIGALSALGYME